jgi:hypothetical protein
LQSTATITQIQVGCVAQCFDASSSNPVTAATAEQILAELDSLLQPPGPPSATPVPGTEESVTSQTSCQQLDGQPSSLSQSQGASESSTTLQLIEGSLPSVLEPSLGNSDSTAQAVSQTVQSIWQLQIGCLFDCVASEQTQDAGETSTTVEGMGGEPSGSGGGFQATVTQVVWQVQIGCIAWCYDTTQVQQVNTADTVVLLTAPPPGPSTPEPEPVSGSGASGPASAAAGADPPPAPASPPPAPADPPPASPSPGAPSPLPERLHFPGAAGRAALTVVARLHRGVAVATVMTMRSAWSPATSGHPVEWWHASITVARIASLLRGAASHRSPIAHSVALVARVRHIARRRALEASAGTDVGFASAAAMLLLLAGALGYAAFRAREQASPDR